MNLRGVRKHKLSKAFLGALTISLVGIALWQMPAANSWSDVSYDYLFRFSARSVTNKVALILLDSAAYKDRDQHRGARWKRSLHTRLLDKLAADGCPLVVFDVFFRFPDDDNPQDDAALALAMRRHGRVVLMADTVEPEHRVEPSQHFASESVQVDPPHKLFLDAATNWGVAKAATNYLETPRRHWPFPAPSSFPSLPWTAAQLAGASLPLPEKPVEQWLRYYSEEGPWASFSYHLALDKPTNYFRNTVVFVGNDPEDTDPKRFEKDKFSTPYTRWNNEAVGGVKIMATTFLNLWNGDWLRRPPAWVEVLLLLLTGLTLGATPFLVRPLTAGAIAAAIAVAAFVGTVLWSGQGAFWFPWLIVTGGQVPCALGLVFFSARATRVHTTMVPPSTASLGAPAEAAPPQAVGVPEAPDYQFVGPAFGEGAFGKVWLVRNAIGQWQALKAVYQARFGNNRRPYDTEFNGIQQYKPISERHLGLLRVDFVSQQKPQGYFYYVMELGDGRTTDWEQQPEAYRPRDLSWVRGQAANQRLPVRECVQIGLVLADALEFLHANGLAHRDIKPTNIIFVGGQPKLADVGLVTRARPPEQITTYAGTPEYMPPLPEPPGTKQADIFALGMVLYVISTGREPAFYPELKTTLVMKEPDPEFMLLNPVILKACRTDITERYGSAAEMHSALRAVQHALERSGKPTPS